MHVLFLEMSESEESILQDIFGLLSGRTDIQLKELSGTTDCRSSSETSVLSFGDLEIHMREQIVYKSGTPIPMILITNKNIQNPSSRSNARDKLRKKGANGKAETIHNLIQGRKDLISKAQFSDFFPNLFDGIHFRGVGRNVKKDNIFWDVQHFRFVPGSTITTKQNDIVRESVGQFP